MLYERILGILERSDSKEEMACRISDMIEGVVERTETAVIQYDGDADYAMKFIKDDLWRGYYDED